MRPSINSIVSVIVESPGVRYRVDYCRVFAVSVNLKIKLRNFRIFVIPRIDSVYTLSYTRSYIKRFCALSLHTENDHVVCSKVITFT